MRKPVIKSSGCPFSHDMSSCAGIPPKKFTWSHDNSADDVDVMVYMDYDHRGGFTDKHHRRKFLWMCESIAITEHQNSDLINNIDDFLEVYDAIFVHDRKMIEVEPRLTYIPNAANKSWIKDAGVHYKTKLISMISSGKTMCRGHQVRNAIANEVIERGLADIYGRKYNPIDRKEEGLNDYMFSVAMENMKYPTYFTEKIMDCFATGTVPIYWGSPDIGDYFNLDGIIVVESFDTLDEDFKQITPELYESMKDAIEDNYNRCMDMKPADDCLYDEILKYE